MTTSGVITLIVVGTLYFAWVLWEIRKKERFGGGETPQEAHDFFAGTVCHCYTDGTRVWFDKHGNVAHFECADGPAIVTVESDEDNDRRYM